MTYSNSQKTSKVISSLGLLIALSLGGLSSCSEKNSPQLKNSDGATFYVDDVKTNGISFQAVGEPNSQWQCTQKLLPIEACIKDLAGTNSVNNLNFKLSAETVSVIKVSDPKGCIQWNELIDFDPNEKEKNIFMSRTVEAVDKHTGSVKITFSVNPWKDSFSYNKQTSINPIVNNAVVYKTKDLSQAALANYDYDIFVKINESGANGNLSSIKRQTGISSLYLKSQGIDYSNLEIDQKLNLTFPYEFELKLSVNLLKQTVNGIDWEKIKRGNFLFHLVLTESLPINTVPKVSDILAVAEFKGFPTGEASLVQIPLLLKFRKISALTKRVGVYLAITSIDTPELFASQSYIGKINGIDANSNLEVSLLKSDVNAKEIYASYLQRPLSITAQDTDLILKKEGFKPLKNSIYTYRWKRDGWFGEKISKHDFYLNLEKNFDLLTTEDDSIEMIEDVRQSLCSFIFGSNIMDKNPNINFKKCVENPQEYLTSEVRDFIEVVEPKPLQIKFGKVESLDVTSSFEMSQNDERSKGYSIDSNLGFSFNLGYELSGSTGTESKKETPVPKDGSPKNDDSNANNPKKHNSTKVKEQPNKLSPAKKVSHFSSKLSAALNLNLGIDGKLYTATGLKISEAASETASVTSSESLVAIPLAVKFNVILRKCLLIKLNDKVKDLAKSLNIDSLQYFCAPKENDIVVENYYFLKHSRIKDSSAIADIYSTFVNPLNILIRGSRPYGLFKSILTSEEYKFTFFIGLRDGNKAGKILDDESSFMVQEAPAMLSSTRRKLL